MDFKDLDNAFGRASNVRFDQKWEILKPELEPLYHTMPVPEIVLLLKDRYQFDANIQAYKYRFKKWGWTKSLSSQKKNEVLDYAQHRTLHGKRNAPPSFRGSEIDVKKLRRHTTLTSRMTMTVLPTSLRDIDQQALYFGNYLPFGNRLFMNWNVPVGVGVLRPHQEPGSPNDPSIPTPSDIDIQTPSSLAHSPPVVGEFGSALSPLSIAVNSKASLDRTRLFLHGRFSDMVMNMSKSDMKLMSQWLYDFWLYAFKFSKQWNRTNTTINPKPDSDLNIYGPLISSPSQSVVDLESPGRDLRQFPSPHCRWAVHVDEENIWYSEILAEDDEGSGSSQVEQELEDPEQQLMHVLESNDFSSIDKDRLPIKVSSVIRAMDNSTTTLSEESLAFAIMSRNIDLIRKLLGSSIDISSIYPLHLASSYLDGGNSCCNIFGLVSDNMVEQRLMPENNHHGHSVLDNLMLTILRSHSKVSIHDIDSSLSRNARFAGIEVDICGRWDADSECFRALLASGRQTIPSTWKHKFCNTSTQAILHCIAHMDAAFDFAGQESSGLFKKLCPHCGAKLELLPLHVIIMTGFQLANHGYEGEDLFGVIACYLALLAVRGNSLLSADISVPALLGADTSSEKCDHMVLTASEFMEKLPQNTNWPAEVEVGWQVLLEIARLADRVVTYSTLDNRSVGEAEDSLLGNIEVSKRKTCQPWDLCSAVSCYGWDKPPALPRILWHVWGAFQTEILNYRRQQVGEPWISNNIDLRQLLEDLLNMEKPHIGYDHKGLMKQPCAHGHFNEHVFPLRDEVSTTYFSNMDSWERSSFIPRYADQ